MIRRLFTYVKLRALERQRAIVWDAFQSTYAAREAEAQARHRKVEAIRAEKQAKLHEALKLAVGR